MIASTMSHYFLAWKVWTGNGDIPTPIESWSLSQMGTDGAPFFDCSKELMATGYSEVI
jgi:hypothetical protein